MPTMNDLVSFDIEQLVCVLGLKIGRTEIKTGIALIVQLSKLFFIILYNTNFAKRVKMTKNSTNGTMYQFVREIGVIGSKKKIVDDCCSKSNFTQEFVSDSFFCASIIHHCMQTTVQGCKFSLNFVIILGSVGPSKFESDGRECLAAVVKKTGILTSIIASNKLNHFGDL